MPTNLEYGMTEASRSYFQRSMWMGGVLGFQVADRVVSLLQDLQVGNAGVAQIIVKHELNIDMPDNEEWYPFERAAKRVGPFAYLAVK